MLSTFLRKNVTTPGYAGRVGCLRRLWQSEVDTWGNRPLGASRQGLFQAGWCPLNISAIPGSSLSHLEYSNFLELFHVSFVSWCLCQAINMQAKTAKTSLCQALEVFNFVQEASGSALGFWPRLEAPPVHMQALAKVTHIDWSSDEAVVKIKFASKSSTQTPQNLPPEEPRLGHWQARCPVFFWGHLENAKEAFLSRW